MRGISTRKVGSFSEQAWGELRERGHTIARLSPSDHMSAVFGRQRMFRHTVGFNHWPILSLPLTGPR